MSRLLLVLGFLCAGPLSSLLAAENDAASSPVSAAKESKPNVVLIISDDQAWTDYSFMGHPSIETPHLDKLASQSVLFERGYVPTALCRPSLATLATGHYTHRHGVTGNDPSPKYAKRDSDLYKQRRAQLKPHDDAEAHLKKRKGQIGDRKEMQEAPGADPGFPTHGFDDTAQIPKRALRKSCPDHRRQHACEDNGERQCGVAKICRDRRPTGLAPLQRIGQDGE